MVLEKQIEYLVFNNFLTEFYRVQNKPHKFFQPQLIHQQNSSCNIDCSTQIFIKKLWIEINKYARIVDG